MLLIPLSRVLSFAAGEPRIPLLPLPCHFQMLEHEPESYGLTFVATQFIAGLGLAPNKWFLWKENGNYNC